MEPGTDSWQRSIRELYESFRQSDEELNLLREIDRSIIERLDRADSVPDTERTDRANPVEEVFHFSLDQLASMHRLREPACCYIYVGDQLLSLADPRRKDELPILETPEVVRGFAENPESELVVLAKDDPASAQAAEDLFAQLPDAETAILQPIYESKQRLLCVLAFTDPTPHHGSHLADPEVAESVRTVARQLSIAYDHFFRAEQEERTRHLWQLFLNSDLKPSRCFHELADMARRVFPTFGPLRLEVKPEVQILMLGHDEEEEPHFMTIRGTTGPEPVITKIKVEESISGLLVQKKPSELEYFCDDPRKYRDIYKSYLGAEEGIEIKSEFAVRLSVGSGAERRLVGVLNLESGLENAFNLHHRAAVLDFANRIAPMVAVFEERIDHNRVMQQSVSAVTAKYLDSLASIFRHGIASPLLAFKGDVEAAACILDKRFDGHDPDGKSQLGEVLDELRAVHDQIKEFTSDFGKEISDFGITGRFDLLKLINETVSLAKRSLLTTTQAPIEIDVDSSAGDEVPFAYCSPLLKQHFFSVLTNAVYSLQEKAEWDPGPHRITVTIERDEEEDDGQEKELNRRWLVTVRDNGVGVDQETLGKLRQFQPESHYRKGAAGMGLGLVALQRYMGSIEGWVQLESVEGEFFEVRLQFDKYRDDIHGPLSILNRGASSDP